jgi:hypothetical protein
MEGQMKTLFQLVMAVSVFPAVGMLGWLALGQEQWETLLCWIAVAAIIAQGIGAVCFIIWLIYDFRKRKCS